MTIAVSAATHTGAAGTKEREPVRTLISGIAFPENTDLLQVLKRYEQRTGCLPRWIVGTMANAHDPQKVTQDVRRGLFEARVILGINNGAGRYWWAGEGEIPLNGEEENG